ncbi:haloacid dehalogenase [Catellatospora methionotrophica]|uniref:Haloacid dehalogenase n=1 Tax=Catellatospora methionotrophica TaxID=121620 RepID=A0A8J3LBS3_9ACTN|nr:haloacid dehalogenase-like hydrolase [Catellatospora methionotrophica]GIG16207.1 haloacid dehalogenase [Catellatospora methionotrophica]
MSLAAKTRIFVLWDVDGTLIDNGGVSKEAYARGFEILTGAPSTQPVVTDGMTDPAIMRTLFERHGLAFSDEPRAALPDVMAAALEALVPRLRERGRAMPGAGQAIAALAAAPGVVQSVLTGNIARNAYAKVAAFGLEAGLDFEVGGYGEDSEVRADLVTAARRKASGKYGTVFSSEDTVLIGDTPRDVEAGRLGGARVVGVCTGKFSEAELRAAGAQTVLRDLRDTAALVRTVVSP